MYLSRGVRMVRRRGVGDSQPLSFPFITAPPAGCTVGAIDPNTGDTIAGCGSPGTPTVASLQQALTNAAAAASAAVAAEAGPASAASLVPSWAYWAAGGVLGLLLLKSLRGR